MAYFTKITMPAYIAILSITFFAAGQVKAGNKSLTAAPEPSGKLEPPINDPELDAGISLKKTPGASSTVPHGLALKRTRAETESRNTKLGFQALVSNTIGTDNTAIGSFSLSKNTTGSSNTALGSFSLYQNINGNRNTAIGFDSLLQNTSGGNNTAIGFESLYKNKIGGLNTAIGVSSLHQNTTGWSNTAIGSYSLYQNKSGIRNTATGLNALHNNTDGSMNTATGTEALYSNTFGERSVAVGYRALFSNTEPSPSRGDNASSNTGIGWQALMNNTTGIQNTAVGESSLTSNITGGHNTAVGEDTLNNNSTGDGNTAIGESALYDNTAGNNNVSLGRYSLNHAKGSYNIAVGTQAGCNLGTGSGNILIGNLGSNQDNGVIRIGGNIESNDKCPSNVTLTKQTATYIAGIAGKGVTGSPVHIAANGQLGIQTSSRRFKEQIEPINFREVDVLGLRPVRYRHKQAAADDVNPVQFGLIAEEVAETIPELVQYDDDGKPFAVKYQFLGPLLLTALQQQQKGQRQQQAMIEALEEQNRTLAKKIGALQQLILELPQKTANVSIRSAE